MASRLRYLRAPLAADVLGGAQLPSRLAKTETHAFAGETTAIDVAPHPQVDRSAQLLALVNGIGRIAGKRRRPRQRPDRVIADRAYDHAPQRRALWRMGVKPVIARRSTEHGSGLGRWRWVIERTFSWLHNFRLLRIRWDRDPDLHMAFITLACAIVCWR